MDVTKAEQDAENRMFRLIKPDRKPPSAVELTKEQEAVLANVRTKAEDHVRRAVIDPDDAEDIVQRTMLAVWDELKRDPRLWTNEDKRDDFQFIVTTHAILDLRRHDDVRRGREPEEEIDLDALPSTRRSQHRHLELKDFFQSLARAVDTLAPRARMIWCLKFLDEMSVAEIAHCTGNEVSAISPSLYKSNLALRPLLRADGYENPQERES
jgi:RNA polymerase sigma factor (sigma-70 family)